MEIKYLQDINGNKVLPVTSASAVRDANGNNVEESLTNLKNFRVSTQSSIVQLNNRIADTYTKQEVSDIISNTPETDVIVIEVPAASQNDIAGWLDANTPSGTDPATGKSVRANKLYRVPGPDNTTYSEWAWDGTNYIMLANKDYGIDNSPTPGSNNTTKSNGILKGQKPWYDGVLFSNRVVEDRVQTMTDSIIDIWASNITDTPSSGSGSWYDADYKLKLGILSFNATSLSSATKILLSFNLTDGTNYKQTTSTPLPITNKVGVSHIVLTLQTYTGVANINVLINLSMLDFSKIDNTPIQSWGENYYAFINDGMETDKGLFVVKKDYNVFDYHTSSADYIKSNPNKWFIGKDTEINALNASQKSILDVVIDARFDTDDANWNNNGWYLKLSSFAVDANTLEDIHRVFFTFLLTDGTVSNKSFYGFADIDNPLKISHIRLNGVSGWSAPIGTVDMVIDLTKLDFSAFPDSPVENYGYIILDDNTAF